MDDSERNKEENKTTIDFSSYQPVDIKNIVIDKDKDKKQRTISYLEQIKNPYLFKVGKVNVKVSFEGNGTLQKKVEHYLDLLLL